MAINEERILQEEYDASSWGEVLDTQKRDLLRIEKKARFAREKELNTWDWFKTHVSFALGKPVGAAMAKAAGIDPDANWDEYTSLHPWVDARPFYDMWEGKLSVGQAVAVYRRAEKEGLWERGYGSPHSPPAMTLQRAIVERWSAAALRNVTQAFPGGKRLPRNAVEVARNYVRLEGACFRLRMQDYKHCLFAAKILCKLSRGLHTLLATVGAVVRCCRGVNLKWRQEFLRVLSEELRKPRRILVAEYGSPHLKWSLLGASVGLKEQTPPPPGCSGRAVKALFEMTEKATDMEGEGDVATDSATINMADVAAMSALLKIFGKGAPAFVTAIGLSVHDAGSSFPSLGSPEGGEFVLRHLKVVREKVARGERNRVFDEIRRLVSTYDQVWAKMTWAEALVESAKTQYVGLAPDVAVVMATLGLDQYAGDRYMKWLEANLCKTAECIPAVRVSGAEINLPGDWIFETLDSHDVRGPLLGLYTNCCQHIDGVGSSCARHGWTAPEGAFFVVKYQERIVAQSWAWRSSDGFTLCFDNIEALSGAYQEGILALYKEASKKLLGRMGIQRVTVGGNHDDVGVQVLPETPAAPHPVYYHGYSDATHQRLLAQQIQEDTRDLGVAHRLGCLEREIYPEALRLGVEDFARDLREYPDHYVQIAQRDGRDVGYIVAFRQIDDVYVSDIAVLRPYREGQVSPQLLSGLLQWVRVGETVRAECRTYSTNLGNYLHENVELISREERWDSDWNETIVHVTYRRTS